MNQTSSLNRHLLKNIYSVRVWDLGSKSCVAVLSGNDREVNSIAKLNETTMISSSGGSNMHLWDLDIARQKLNGICGCC